MTTEPACQPAAAAINKTAAGAQQMRERVRRIRDYIHAHLDQPLDLDHLADLAGVSRFHWHRVYRGATGETAAQTVRRLRLERAAFQLASSATPIAEVALAAGYATPAAFSKAFTPAFGLPPATFRKAGQHTAPLRAAEREDAMAFAVDLRTFSTRPGLGLVHEGPYLEIGRSFGQLSERLAAAGQMPHVRGMFGRYVDDPDIVPAEQLRSHACAFMDSDSRRAPGLEPIVAAGGSYAVLTYKGPYAGLGPAYDWLFGTWLPQSGREAADDPVLEIYLNTPMDTAPADLLTEVCLRLKSSV